MEIIVIRNWWRMERQKECQSVSSSSHSASKVNKSSRAVRTGHLSMLTKKSQRLINSIFLQATLLKIIPYSWDEEKKHLVPLYGWNSFPSIVFQLIILANGVYMSFSFFRIRHLSSVSSSSKSLHVLLLLSAILSSIFGYNNFKRRIEITSFVHKFFQFHNQLEQRFLKDGIVPRINSCELLLQSFIFMPYLQSFCGIFMLFKDPSAPRYFYSVVADFLPPSFLFVFMFFEYFLYVAYWFIILFSVVQMLSYWYGTTYWLQEMRFLPKEMEMYGSVIRETSSELRRPSVSINLYTCMQLLSKEAHDSLSPLILPWIQFFVILIPSSCNYVLIRFHDHLSLITLACMGSISLSCVAIASLAYPVAASLYTISMAYISDFKKPHLAQRLTRNQKKKVRSFRPLKMRVGSFLFIRHFAVLKLINSIIYWTMRTLLIYR